MIANSLSLSERIHKAFAVRERSVVELVDDLLALARDQPLQLEWHADQCHVRPLGGALEAAAELPVPRSVFRAILARIAALCNERNPNSVSPYGGKGELATGNPVTVFRADFANTAAEQRLQLRAANSERDGA